MSRGKDAPLTPEQQSVVTQNTARANTVAAAHASKLGLELGDARSICHQQLVTAALSFDRERGVPFEAYAWIRMIGGLESASRKQRTEQARLSRLQRAALKYSAGVQSAGDPFVDTEADTRARQQRATDGFLFAAWLGWVMQSRETPEDELGRSQHQKRSLEMLEAILDSLPERDRDLLRLHYWEDVDLLEAGKRLGMSRATVYRHHQSALARAAERFRKGGIHGTAPNAGA